jgi:hypothetical protein
MLFSWRPHLLCDIPLHDSKPKSITQRMMERQVHIPHRSWRQALLQLAGIKGLNLLFREHRPPNAGIM